MSDERAHAKRVVNDLSLFEPVTRELVQSIIAVAKPNGVELKYGSW